MFVTPDMVTRAYASVRYAEADRLYNEQQQLNEETSLVEQNATDFIQECDALGIVGQADDSERV